MSEPDLPPVAVFEVGLPPALSFIRSLGRAEVPLQAYGSTTNAAGRYSRYVDRFELAPDPHDVDRFLEWLDETVDRHGLTLIAPTSDYMAYAIAEYDEQNGTNLSGGMGGSDGAAMIRDCLFKDRFARRMEEIDFPVPAWSTPTSTEEALVDAELMGYPVVLKPRSHVGIGLTRGLIVHNEAELRAHFAPYPLGDDQATAQRHDEFLAWPLLQQMVTGADVRVVSLTGHIDRDGCVRGLECSHKTSQWGGGLGIGTMFEAVEPPPFVDHALEAVRHVLRVAIFEFEVLVDDATDRYWALELNPRGFGQMSLSVARGSDLPLEWYRTATGLDVPSSTAPRQRTPDRWCLGTPYLAGAAVRAVRGPNRRSLVSELTSTIVRPTAAAVHSWSDPRPGLAFVGQMLRHPGGLVRPFLER